MTKVLEFTPENKIAQLGALLKYLEAPNVKVTIETIEGEQMKIYKTEREITGEFTDISSLTAHLDAIAK